MIFKNNKVYEVLKWIALVGCYALWVAWTRLAQVWGFPYADQIGETINIVGIVIGILIGISGIRYKWQNAVEPVEIPGELGVTDEPVNGESEG